MPSAARRLYHGLGGRRIETARLGVQVRPRSPHWVKRIVAGSPAPWRRTMSKTATTAIKFYVKENPDGKPFLSLEFHGGLPNDVLLLNEAHLYLNFRQQMSIDEAKDIARQMNEN